MEFFLYLSPIGQEIFSLVSKHVRVTENAPICRKHEIYGWFDAPRKTMTLCTETIKRGPEPRYYANETLFHESVHVAQWCKNGRGWVKPLGIGTMSMPLSQRRKNDIQAAKRIVAKDISLIEHEAFWMEDKPDKVKYILKKFCF
jgi:hypothetical protein